MKIAHLRREYRLTGLRRDDLDADPITQFKRWFEQAAGLRASGRIQKFLTGVYKAFLMLGGTAPVDVNAMTLATTDEEGQPTARVVLLKGVDERGFIFFTNYRSSKGRHLAVHPDAALVFYWADLERQICISGPVARLPQAESDTYFASRPRPSQIAAWASNQSQTIPDRAALEAAVRQHAADFQAREVPRPPHWGGYVLCPTRIEFWQGRPNRLHDRFRYIRSSDKGWIIERLAP